MRSKNDYEEYDELFASESKKNKKSDRSSLLNSLKEIEGYEYDLPGFSNKVVENPKITDEVSSFCPSDMFSSDRKKGKKSSNNNSDYDPDSWFNEMVANQSSVKIRKSKFKGELFDVMSGGKKKKKKHKKDGVELTDYKKEFEPEVALLKNLLVDQNRFTESLQREYDSLNAHKSSSRGVNKQMTDLIENITQARSLSLQIVKEHVNAKKLVSELSMKQRKELGVGSGENSNIADFASNYLKQVLNSRGAIVGDGTGDGEISDYSEDEIYSEIAASLSLDEESSNRPEEIDKYLKYENRDVSIYVLVNADDYENYEFIAKDKDGVIIDDYPLPNHTTLSINKSTHVATDEYGQKYTIIYE